VWIVDLAVVGARLLALEKDRHLLTEAESARADLIADPARRTDWIAAHAALHLTLADRVGQPLQFATGGVDAKPRIAGWDGDFSLTHSGRLALIAIREQGHVGIDVEVRRNVSLGAARRRLIEIAGAACAERPLPVGDPEMSFLAAWVRLEAIGKMRATGIGALLETLGIVARGLGAETVAERTRRLVIDEAQPIGVADIDVGRFDAVAALATSPPAGPPMLHDLAAELASLGG
jgi:4'-phosphopantetheinyl transferase